ncbi:hypothetical protein AKO1_004115 [Acrasis kona]|uniref:Uncharacterized protein n=1 Tax=Acrasis kona TaxID=1008807 RepID=A0AAW2ZA29_9EUKA
MSSRCLMMFYVLTVNDCLTHHHNGQPNNLNQYGADVIQEFNVVKLVDFIRRDGRRLLGNSLYAQLLSLIFDQLRHLFHLDLLLTTPFTFPNLDQINHIETDQMQKILNDPIKDQCATKIVLDQLFSMEPNQQVDLLCQHVIERTLPSLICSSDHVQKYVWISINSLWNKMCMRDPMRTNLSTLISFSGSENELDHQEFYRSIIIIFKVRKNVLMIPSLLNIFLQILGSYTIASRRHVTSIDNKESNASSRRSVNSVPSSTSMLSQTYSLTQESTVIQLLLEVILLSEDATTVSDVREIKKMICSYIHQRFIEQPVLAKLIHFQTYNPSLIETTVEYISSIHVCMDFLPELMSQPQIERQVFGVELASRLCEKYPLQRCVELARLAISRMRKMANKNGSHRMNVTSNAIVQDQGSGDKDQGEEVLLCNVSSSDYEDGMIHVMDSLVRFVVAFPFLAVECIAVLNDSRTNFSKSERMVNSVSATFDKLSSSVISLINK